MHDYGKAQTQKRPEKTLNLHLRPIFSTETVYNNNNTNNRQNIPQQTGRKEVNMLLRFTTFFFQFMYSVLNKKFKAYKKTEKYDSFKAKK